MMMMIIIIIIIIIITSVLRQVHGLFKSEFSRQCYVVVPLSCAVIFSIPQGHPTAAYVFFLVF
jgi:hypothetical protein